MRISDWSSDVCSSDLLPGGQRDKAIPELHLQQVGRCFQNILSCRSGAHENLTLVPLSSLARDEGKPFQTIKAVGHRCLTKLEGRGNDAWSSFAATIYFLQHQHLRRRQPRAGGWPCPTKNGSPTYPPTGLKRQVGYKTDRA